MKDLLQQFVTLYDTHEEYQRRLGAYERALKTQEWEFVRDTFMMIRATILSEMLSAKHTALDEKEKDVMQRTYYHVNQILDFLSEPKKWIQYRSRWNSVVEKIGRRATQVRRKGKDHAGRDNA